MSKPSKKKTDWLSAVATAAKWHETIAESLSQPILPEGLNEEEKNAKLQTIAKQSEQHYAYSKVLTKLVSLSKNA